MKNDWKLLTVFCVLATAVLTFCGAAGQGIAADGYLPYPALDFFVYSNLDTGGGSGSYGVDGFVGADGIDRIIFYKPASVWCDGYNCGSVSADAYIYTVTIPEGADPNMHPNNPEDPGPVAPRTFNLERSFSLGVNPGHESEFYVDAEDNVIYLGASQGIRKYVFDPAAGTYVFDSQMAPPAPFDGAYSTQSLAYDAVNNTWYAGSISWNDDPGVTLRDMWKYDGSQGNAGAWTLAFQYTTPEGTDWMTHHDGVEFINGYLYLADYVGDYIKQYTTDGTPVDVFWHEPLNHELEGMGHGALGHFWAGSHGATITEFGGGRLQHATEDSVRGHMTGGGKMKSATIIVAGDANGNGVIEWTDVNGNSIMDPGEYETITVSGMTATHGFTLNCPATEGPNNLEINWGKGNKFHLENVTQTSCSDDPAIDEGKPDAGFDTLRGSGTGRYNGNTGATVEWEFKDAGEPGKNDTAHIIIKDAGGTIVLEITGSLNTGDQQAHPADSL